MHFVALAMQDRKAGQLVYPIIAVVHEKVGARTLETAEYLRYNYAEREKGKGKR